MANRTIECAKPRSDGAGKEEEFGTNAKVQEGASGSNGPSQERACKLVGGSEEIKRPSVRSHRGTENRELENETRIEGVKGESRQANG